MVLNVLHFYVLVLFVRTKSRRP